MSDREREEPLRGLDEIPWSTFRHAYGEARDTPRHLRDVASTVAGTRGAAHEALVDSLVHQGSVHPAAVPAIRFLVELLDHPGIRDKDRIVSLIHDMAVGAVWWAAHLDQLRSRGVPFSPSEERGGRETRLARDIRDEIKAHARVFVERLGDDDVGVRHGAAAILAGVAPLEDERIGRRVREIRDRTADETTRADLLCLLARLDRRAHDDLLRTELSTGETPLARLAAAIELGIRHREPSEGVPELLTTTFLARDEALIRQYASLAAGRDYWPTLAILIARSGGDAVERCLRILIARVEGSSWCDRSSLRGMMAMAFARDGRIPERPSELQRRAVLALAVKSFARVVDRLQPGWPVLGEFGLPTTREGLDDWLGLPRPEHPGFTLGA
jgi:hypothetical protein